MKGWGPILVVAGLLLLAGGGVAYAAGEPKRANVGNRWAAAGVLPQLQQLLNAWEQEGWFDIEVGTPFAGFPGGGLRTAADAAGQAAACEAGLSHACDLASTPHGRGAALDIWPAGFVPTKTYAQQPGMLDLMKQFGAWARSKGFTWGGDWADPDYPHIEIPGWQALPFPPPGGGYFGGMRFVRFGAVRFRRRLLA